MSIRSNLIIFRKTREKGKRSQTYFAKKLNISRQQYINIENGKSNPSFGLMQKFGKVFEGEYDDLWELFNNGE